MKKSYLERQNAFVTAFNITPGSKVKVLRIASDHEDDWRNSWPSEMNRQVGKTLTVREEYLNNPRGIPLSDGKSYPFFVLQHISAPSIPVSVRVELNGEHTAVVSEKKIVVGCQTFKTDVVKKLQDALDEVTEKPKITPKKKKKTTKRKK